jgi:hypothetical protein
LTLPTVEVVSSRPFTSAERHTREPKDQQNCGHNPKKMGCEPDSRKKQHKQKYQQDNHDVSYFLDVGVVPTNHVSSSVINDCPVSTHAGTQTRDQRKDGSDCSHDHQNDADRVDVESMLVGIYRDSEIQNGPNSKDHDACG